MKRLILISLVGLSIQCLSQTVTQTIRGQVIEHDSRYPLAGALVVSISDTSKLIADATDADGHFALHNVSMGRHSLKVSFVGYENVIVSDIMVTSAKESVLSILMKESSVKLSEVTVTANQSGEPSNEMALVSARSFTVEETGRYAGSRSDPARMASNFAGVQGADDSRNDIVIRGNSPQAVLWRIEGINAPNPNHFNIPGTAGGPVTILNSKTLANSDFYTGAFPAEFGNTVAGVFDLNLRNGNRQNHEWSGQFGFLGTEMFGEGPLNKKQKSSYLFAYRYSTLALFSELNINIGTSAVPRYQDLTFKFNLPLKKKGSISFFGMGGNSNIDILISNQKHPSTTIYGANDRDQYFGSITGIVGANYKQPISAASFITMTVAFSSEEVNSRDDKVYRHIVPGTDTYQLDSLFPLMRYKFRQSKLSSSVFYVHKLSAAGAINAGANADVYFFNFIDSIRNYTASNSPWHLRWNSREQALLLQPFIQWKYSLGSNIDLVAGLHSQYFSLTNSFIAIEPRIGLQWKLSENKTVSFGAGLHSQIQPGYMYFYGDSIDTNGKPVLQNKHIDFTRSGHVVVGYQLMLSRVLRVKTEVYYQHLFNVPVEKNTSSFSLLNTGSGFSRFFPNALMNKAVGNNYGAELTVEKFFSKGYLFLFTGSLYEAKYKGSDNVWRNTDFNGNYVLNALITKEWNVKGRNTFCLGGKITLSGGHRYGPIDSTLSEKQQDVVYANSTYNSLQFRPYFRADIRVTYKINRPKVSHEIALDLINILGVQNMLGFTYVENPSPSVQAQYQLGFLPLFYYKIDF